MPQLAGWSLPFMLGHENAGWLEGGETAGMDINTPVVIAPAWGCWTCKFCRADAESYCDYPDPAGSGGLGRNGGLAEYMVASASLMIPLN